MERPHPFSAIRYPALPARPRTIGLTSVLDKGLGPAAAADHVALSGEWIDVVKLGWATARLSAEPALRAKVTAYREAGIGVSTGGTFLEIAHAQSKVDA